MLTFMNWNEEARNIIKAEKARQNLEWADISRLLKDHLDIEIESRLLGNRINGGAFSFALALQIFSVIGVDKVLVPVTAKVDRLS